jgi:ATP-dependent Zn protease
LRNNSRNAVFIVGALILLGFIVLSIVSPKIGPTAATKVQELQINELNNKIKADKVTDAKWQGNEITGHTTDGVPYKTTYIDNANPNAKGLVDLFNEHNVNLDFPGPGPGSTISNAAAFVLPTLVLFGVLWVVLSRRAQARVKPVELARADQK